jgi:hypothetical protein
MVKILEDFIQWYDKVPRLHPIFTHGSLLTEGTRQVENLPVGWHAREKKISSVCKGEEFGDWSEEKEEEETEREISRVLSLWGRRTLNLRFKKEASRKGKFVRESNLHLQI